MQTETERGKKRGMISPQEIFLSLFLVFISSSSFFTDAHTHLFTLSPPPPPPPPPPPFFFFFLKNKKYCCTCREAAWLVFSLFFCFCLLLHPLQRAVNCDRCERLRLGDERDNKIGREGGCRDGAAYRGQRE